MSVNSSLLDKSIRHATYLERYKSGEVRRILDLFEDTRTDLLSSLEKRLRRIGQYGYDTSVTHTDRIRRLLDTTFEEYRTGVTVLGRDAREELKELAITEAEWSQRVMKETMPIEIDFTIPNRQTLHSVVTSRPMEGHLVSRYWQQLSNVDDIRKQLNIGLTRGDSIPRIVSRVRRFTDLRRRHVTALVRTSVNHVSTHAREMTYEENDDVIKGVQWVSTLDRRTTITCADLDGRVFKIGQGERPPAHFQCRSTTVPITKSWREMGLKGLPKSTRASMDGQVPERTTFSQWLKRQPKDVQEDVLGVGRAKMFREGESISSFTDSGHRPLTLSELKGK